MRIDVAAGHNSQPKPFLLLSELSGDRLIDLCVVSVVRTAAHIVSWLKDELLEILFHKRVTCMEQEGTGPFQFISSALIWLLGGALAAGSPLSF